MAEFQELLDFPPAPKLGWDGKLDPAKATPPKCMGKRCSTEKVNVLRVTCRPITPTTPCITAGRAVLQAAHRQWNGDGSRRPIKTFPLRGVKDTPPYMHDGRLLTLDDTVEYFNLVLDRNLTEQEKKDLVTSCEHFEISFEPRPGGCTLTLKSSGTPPGGANIEILPEKRRHSGNLLPGSSSGGGSLAAKTRLSPLLSC